MVKRPSPDCQQGRGKSPTHRALQHRLQRAASSSSAAGRDGGRAAGRCVVASRRVAETAWGCTTSRRRGPKLSALVGWLGSGPFVVSAMGSPRFPPVVAEATRPAIAETARWCHAAVAEAARHCGNRHVPKPPLRKPPVAGSPPLPPADPWAVDEDVGEQIIRGAGGGILLPSAGSVGPLGPSSLLRKPAPAMGGAGGPPREGVSGSARPEGTAAWARWGSRAGPPDQQETEQPGPGSRNAIGVGPGKTTVTGVIGRWVVSGVSAGSWGRIAFVG